MVRKASGGIKNKKAFAYFRKSIEREADKSIEGQREVVQRYAKENNIEMVAEFEEVASSATIEREQLEAMLEALKKHKDIDYILLHRFDRITREILHMGYIMTLLNRTKTRLHSVTEDNDYENDPTKIMMIIMKTYGSTIERMAIVERMQEGRRRKQQKGGFLGGTPPVGYKSIIGTGKLAIEPSEVPIIETVFLLKEEGLSMDKIAEELNKKGFVTRKNKQFHATTVQRILKYKIWYEGKGEAPAIIK
ncbi:recombinase family protein [Bacillus sp. BRMEA1]|uniref:recombinase family protein n=1 Tax=Neobacillus endophyticus TaxID=2738405 RepID=UPI0015673CFE|nr:recombinase family protein [Neobacillus endophyticus]NRD76213.1 recombinase family protein [Neobacillus endophyticus]